MKKSKARKQMLKALATKLSKRKWVVAGTRTGFIAYHIEDYDNMLKGQGYCAPITITKFTSLSNACKYIREQEDDCPFDDYDYIDYIGDLHDDDY